MPTINWAKVGEFINSPAGQSLINAGGASLLSLSQQRQSEKDRAFQEEQSNLNRGMTREQFTAQMLQRLIESSRANYDSDRTFNFNQATTAASMFDPRAEMEWAQKQKLAQAILPKMTFDNIKYTPGDPAVAAAMGNMTGGMQLSSPINLKGLESIFSDPAILEALSTRNKDKAAINPNASLMDLTKSFGPQAEPFNVSAGNYQTLQKAQQSQELANLRDDQDRNRELLMKALNGESADSTASSSGGPQLKMINGKQMVLVDGAWREASKYEIDPNTGQVVKSKGPSAFKKFASVAIPLAATVATGGITSPWLAASLAGGAGIAGSKIGGANWKQALINGGLSAATSGFAPNVGAAKNNNLLKAVAKKGVWI